MGALITDALVARVALVTRPGLLTGPVELVKTQDSERLMLQDYPGTGSIYSVVCIPMLGNLMHL